MDIQAIIKKHYNIDVKNLEPLTGGFRNLCFKVTANNGNSFVFIIYRKDELFTKRLIKDAHSVAISLQELDFPTRIPIETVLGEDFFQDDYGGTSLYMALYNYLEGETIPWEAYTRRHIKSMGKTLSDIHAALVEIPNLKSEIRNKTQDSKSQIADSRFTNKAISQLAKWDENAKKELIQMEKYFREVEPWIEKKLDVQLNWEKIIPLLKDLVPETNNFKKNVLHYDFTRGNILFSKKLNEKLGIYPITGILDFEKVCYGPEIADIARTLAFLIIDCKFKKEATVRERFLVSGYNRRGENKLEFEPFENPVLENLLNFFWLRDFWSFLKYNPYEFLYMNEHYVRTRNQLFRTKALKKSKTKKSTPK